MKKTMKITIASICAFIALAALARYSLPSTMVSLTPEGVNVLYTNLTEPLFLRLKFMLFSGLAGAAMVIGVAFGKQLKMPARLSMMLLSPAAASFMAYLFLKTRMISITKIADEAIGVNAAISLKEIHMELIPIAGLATAIILAALMIIRNRRELTTPEAPLQTEG